MTTKVMRNCASCGKSGDGLKICTACRTVWYCGVPCQRSHRKSHRKLCTAKDTKLKTVAASDDAAPPPSLATSASKAVCVPSSSNSAPKAASIPDPDLAALGLGIRCFPSLPEGVDLSGDTVSPESFGALLKMVSADTANRSNAKGDEELFAPTPPREDCAICTLPLPFAGNESSYQSCCGHTVCCGCSVTYSMSIPDIRKTCCPFCRKPVPKTDEEMLERSNARMEHNDATAFLQVGLSYQLGKHGLSKDERKAFQLLLRSAELGLAEACFCVADCYFNGKGVNKNEPKNRHYLKLAAMGGDMDARHFLGKLAFDGCNYVLAAMHWRISAAAGHKGSLKRTRLSFEAGLVTKDEYAADLRAFQKAHDEVKSKERDRSKEAWEQEDLGLL